MRGPISAHRAGLSPAHRSTQISTTRCLHGRSDSHRNNTDSATHNSSTNSNMPISHTPRSNMHNRSTPKHNHLRLVSLEPRRRTVARYAMRRVLLSIRARPTIPTVTRVATLTSRILPSPQTSPMRYRPYLPHHLQSLRRRGLEELAWLTTAPHLDQEECGECQDRRAVVHRPKRLKRLRRTVTHGHRRRLMATFRRVLHRHNKATAIDCVRTSRVLYGQHD